MLPIGLILPVLLFASQPPRPDCPDLNACHQAALEAAARQDFERFHDFAWRAIQKGRPNDPDLMRLVARAQSLSGRPGDALVMLRRLAQMGVVTDARESEDFQAVRALPGWPEVESLIARVAEDLAAPPSSAAAPAAAARSRVGTPGAATPSARSPASSASSSSPAAIETVGPARSYPAAAAATTGVEEALRLPENPLEPIGLAYDGASRRFVVGDRRANKVIVADEVFRQVNDLIGAASAGFGSLNALEIDARRGDLWVTSHADDGVAAIHRLQLVSGRVLSRIDMAADAQPAALDDIFVGESGALWLVDSRGSRLFRLRTADGHVERRWPLSLSSPSSFAIVNEHAYVAHQGGLALIDLASGGVTDVHAAKGLSLTGLRRVRWNRGALIAIQADAAGAARLVRIRLARNGHTATAVDVLDANVDTNGAALTVSREAVYYVAQTSSGPTIRRVRLK